MDQTSSRRVKILRDTVANKIAAGEVIDRPFSILRELLDNSLDSGASQIDVRLSEGGIRVLEVQDDGCGMTKEDLELCWLPHATSKITTEEDLQSLRTLGFRGEALSAVAACARLKIETAMDHSGAGYRLEVDHLGQPQVSLAACRKGTKVRSEDLFFSIPARRRFLKSPGAEALACQRTLEEKALAFPQVSFRFYLEDKLKLHLPVESLKDRLYRIFDRDLALGMMDEVPLEDQGVRGTLFTSRPGLNRSDRKLIHIYANRRKIQEYAFVQAVHYAYKEYLPGGLFPCTFVFLEVDPDLVDFNIHPAKKEARFRNAPRIHSRLVETLRSYLSSQNIKFTPLPSREGSLFDRILEVPEGMKSGSGASRPQPETKAFQDRQSPEPEPQGNFFASYKRVIQAQEAAEASPAGELDYLGQIMGVFHLVMRAGRLFLVDQHAAHERILFESYLESPGRPQALLVPLPFLAGEETRSLLEERRQDLENLGIRWTYGQTEEGLLTAVPEKCTGMEGEILDFLQNQTGSLADLQRDLYARMSCRGAVMDGDLLDPPAALDLIHKAFALNNARCPHGRPVWIEFSKEDLYRMFGRIV